MHARQLQAFLTIVDVGSFTRAAAHLGITQPTVSSRIKALEEDVGGPLLDRLSTGVQLTEAGRDLLPYAREIVALSVRARDAVRARGEPHGEVTVGAIESLTSYRLLPLIEYLYIRYPQVQVSFQSIDHGDPRMRVRDRLLDCAFFIGGEYHDDDLNIEVLCPEPLSLVVGRDHPLADRRSVTTNDLRAMTLVRCERYAPYHGPFEATLGCGGTGRRVIDLDSIDAAKRSVIHGLGMALLPRLTVAEELADGRLHRLPWKVPFESHSQVAWRRDHSRHPALQLVIEAATKVISEQLD